ncbi:tyrosine-type recombinase/integrase (plasmid) [Hymenobacter tibetensis]|uniref:Tyrosine-type recombinase/integrase n=1 Tax=Hymenobacter tibetensis TaxID=497967 RepID=A0ABY4D5F7_9BACT|nr:tyrosine-type recombinase/integrase [Hymenobacter tibetensis]UOG77432.1 tyrosine-type recombinase/integrase [Hymenobacter tibetensis]
MLITEWPSQLVLFDRAASLTNHEKILLATWINHAPADKHKAHRNRHQELHPLQRLIQPIESIFACCKYNDPSLKYKFACCALLLKEMYERQTSMWAWSEDTWLEIVGVTQLEFSDRYGDFRIDWLPMLPTAHCLRPILVNCAYLIKRFPIHQAITNCHIAQSARRILGDKAISYAIETVRTAMREMGRSAYYNVPGLTECLCLALLLNQKPELEELTVDLLKEVAAKPHSYQSLKPACVTISEALYSWGILSEVLPPVVGAPPLTARKPKVPGPKRRKDLLPPEWGELLDRWCTECGNEPRTVESQRSRIAKIVRYVVDKYPTKYLPQQWNVTIAQNVVQAVDGMRVGEWNNPSHERKSAFAGEKLKPAVKAQLINAIRCFFTYGQENKWFTLRFNPHVDLRTPKEIIDEIRPNPKAIEDSIWEKVTQAALTLAREDITVLTKGLKINEHEASYPAELVQALACVLVFGGLRRDEILRLESGCVRLPPHHDHDSEARKSTLAHICILKIPVNKSCGEFRKPVDYRLRALVDAWEAIRPAGHRRQDKTAKGLVHFLFEWRGRSISAAYINQVLIPLLCRKARVNDYDTKGRIHCHRVRATLATRYYKAGLGTEELRQWLGHGNQVSLRNYLDLDDEWNTQQHAEAIRDDKSSLDYATAPDALLNNACSPHLFDADQDSEFVEQEKEPEPGNYLAHLFNLPKVSSQGFVLRAQESLADLLRNVDVPADERRQLATMNNVLIRLAMRS